MNDYNEYEIEFYHNDPYELVMRQEDYMVDCFGNVYENMRGNWYPSPYISWRKLEEFEECMCGDCN